MEIKKAFIGLVYLLTGVLSLSSCRQDVLDDISWQAEGDKIYLNMSLPAADEIVVSRATASELEKVIYTVHVLAFDNNDKCFYNQKVYDGYASKTPYQTSQALGIMKQTGSEYADCTVWAIANAGVWVGANGSYNFDEVKTLSDLQKTYGYRLLQGNQLEQRDCLAMTGMVENVDMTQPTSVDAPITLDMKRALARVTFTIDVPNDNLEFYFNDWSVEGLPRYTYVIPHENDFATEEQTPPTTYDFYYPSNDAEMNLVTYPVSKWLSDMEPSTFGFYTYENRRGGRLPNPNPDNLQGEAGDYAEDIKNLTDNANSPKFKTLYAPENASFIILTGLIREKDTKNVTSFAYKIALGANNADDYNLLRNHNYVYNIHINGVHYDDITVDAFDSRVHKAYALQISAPYSESMDAHYDKRYLNILASAGKIDLQLYPTQQDAEAGTNPLGDDAWIVLSDMNTYNIDIDPDESSAKTLDYGDVENQTLYIYTDENVSTQSRSAVLKITHTPEQGSSEIVSQPVVRYYIYTQAGLIEANGIYVESYEEYGMNLNPYGTEQPVTGLQWGWDKVNYTVRNTDATSPSNGYDNSNVILGYATNNPHEEAYEDVDVQSIYNNYAARYCYNKNKRNADGEVDAVEWYLPALNEMINVNTNITEMSGKRYWTSTVPTENDTHSNPIEDAGGLGDWIISALWELFYGLFVDTGGEDGDFYYTRVAKTVQDGVEGRYTVYYSATIFGFEIAQVPVRVYNPKTDRISVEFGQLNGKNHVRCVRRMNP